MFPIAWITLRRISEKSVLVQFGILALVLIYVGLGLEAIIMTENAGSEQSGLGVTWLFLSVFTVFWATIEIPREIDRKEVHVYLAKPINRLRYLLGKYLGMTGMVLAGEVMLLGIFCVCLWIKGNPPSVDFLIGAGRIALFLMLLNAICASVSLLMVEVAAMVTILFILGAAALSFALPILAWAAFDRGPAAGWMAVYYLVPNLLHFRWNVDSGTGPYLGALAVYTLGWTALCLVIGWAFFRRQDLP